VWQDIKHVINEERLELEGRLLPSSDVAAVLLCVAGGSAASVAAAAAAAAVTAFLGRAILCDLPGLLGAWV